MNPVLRSLAALAALTLLADSPVPLHGPRHPTVVAAGTPQVPVVAVASTVQVRAAAARTAVVVIVNAGSGPAENAARVAAVRNALSAAAPQAEFATRTFETSTQAGQRGFSQLGGRVAVVVPGTTAGAARFVADAIRPFAFARVQGIENEPADCVAAQAAATPAPAPRDVRSRRRAQRRSAGSWARPPGPTSERSRAARRTVRCCAAATMRS